MKKRITHNRLLPGSLFFLLFITTGLFGQTKGTAKGQVASGAELTPAGVTTFLVNNTANLANENASGRISLSQSFGTTGVVFNLSLSQNVKAVLKKSTVSYNEYLIYLQTTSFDNTITQFATALDQKTGVQSCQEVNSGSSNRTEIATVRFDLGLSESDILDIIANTIF